MMMLHLVFFEHSTSWGSFSISIQKFISFLLTCKIQIYHSLFRHTSLMNFSLFPTFHSLKQSYNKHPWTLLFVQSPMTWITGHQGLYNLNYPPKWLHPQAVVRAHISPYPYQHLTLSKHFFAIGWIKKICPFFKFAFQGEFSHKNRFLSPILKHPDLRLKNLCDLQPSQVMHREVLELVPEDQRCHFQICCSMILELLPSPKPMTYIRPSVYTISATYMILFSP